MIAKSFERIHRSNLVGMGLIPLCFKPGQDADTLGLTGHERFTIDLPSKVSEIRPGQDVVVTTDTGKSFTCTLRFDTEVCVELLIFWYVFLFGLRESYRVSIFHQRFGRGTFYNLVAFICFVTFCLFTCSLWSYLMISSGFICRLSWHILTMAASFHTSSGT